MWQATAHWGALSLLIASFTVSASCRKEEPDEFVRLMNLGKAYLENRESAKAIEVLKRAVAIEPDSVAAWRNLARGHLIARNSQEALDAVDRAAALERESPATSYLRGLALVQLSRFDEAVISFEGAVRLDPHVATLRFQLASAYQALGQHEKALEQQRETVRLDPLHTSAQFKLATHARRVGDLAEFERRHGEFMRLRTLFGEETRSADALEQCIYTQPEPARVPGPERDGDEKPIDVRFTDATEQAFASESDAAATAMAVIDVDAAGRSVLFVVDSGGAPALMQMNAEGVFVRNPVTVGPHGGPYRCHRTFVGDFYDTVPQGGDYDPKIHAKNDVLLLCAEGVQLLKQTTSESFADVTEAAGLAGVTANGARWVDFEHDGDLDLMLAGEAGVAVWQNNGDGTFKNVTSEVGVDETGPAVDIAAIDLDANNAVDLAVLRGTAPTLVLENQRAGTFARRPDPPGPWPAARAALINDVNNDGRLNALLVAVNEAVAILGGVATRPRIDLSAGDVKVVTFIDYDNDGWLDVFAAGADRGHTSRGWLRLYRNAPAPDAAVAWKDASTATGIDTLAVPSVRDVIAADFDGDGDTDLLLQTADASLRWLRNEGGHVNGQLKVRLQPTKTNPSGLGTRIELRQGSWWVARAVTALPIEIGLGRRDKLDTLQTLWTNGVVDNQVEVALGRTPMTVVEKVVATGSCPFLYAWSGDGFRFVTDLLGNSPLGLSIQRDVMLPADPDEYVEIGPAHAFPPRDGKYVLEITEETREVLYLDEARLVAVDHPTDVEIHPTDKLMPEPFPPSELWALTKPRRLARAEGDDGLDRTDALRELDGDFAPPGRQLPPPYRGMCHPMALTLDFGELNPTKLYVLALTGWLQYGDASTNIALSQNSSIEVIPPRLEAETAPGVWTQLDVVVGMPAGKTKTILVDLAGRLPVNAHRLRLSNTFEIRWDRIALFERTTLPPTHVHEVSPGRADLYYRGFSEIRSRAPGHPTTPAYDQVSALPPWRTTPSGWCTRYGDVLELVTRRDEALVLINGGDALTLQFDAGALPPAPEDHSRTFFFYSVGWDKDEDHNVVDGDTVEPLPVGEPDAAWRIQYNTRWVPHEVGNKGSMKKLGSRK